MRAVLPQPISLKDPVNLEDLGKSLSRLHHAARHVFEEGAKHIGYLELVARQLPQDRMNTVIQDEGLANRCKHYLDTAEQRLAPLDTVYKMIEERIAVLEFQCSEPHPSTRMLSELEHTHLLAEAYSCLIEGERLARVEQDPIRARVLLRNAQDCIASAFSMKYSLVEKLEREINDLPHE